MSLLADDHENEPQSKIEVEIPLKNRKSQACRYSMARTYRGEVGGGGGIRRVGDEGMREGGDDDEPIPRDLCGEFDKNGFSLMRRGKWHFVRLNILTGSTTIQITF